MVDPSCLFTGRDDDKEIDSDNRTDDIGKSGIDRVVIHTVTMFTPSKRTNYIRKRNSGYLAFHTVVSPRR